jgi:HTH-type transcriptional regulator / antitoxin HipB
MSLPIGIFPVDLVAIFLYGKVMIKSSSDFGALVRAKRKALGWTQAELAARCGTGERFIVELEGGKPSCHLEKSLIAARVVGIQLGDLKDAATRVDTVEDDALAHLPRFDR